MTIYESVNAELIEKKSRFISNIFYIEDASQAEDIIKGIRKKYYDAKHVCYAYSFIKKNDVINKSSDDGEPSGTAGAPILNLIIKNNLKNILIIVVRYFGGILLGTGGLVKAYTLSSQLALENAKLVEEEEGKEVYIEVNYKEFDKFKYFCKKQNITIDKIEYEKNINIILYANESDIQTILDNKDEKSIKVEKIEVGKSCKIRKNVDIIINIK